MKKPQIALMTFGDARDHEWNNLFRGLTEPRHQNIIEYFEKLPIELHVVRFGCPHKGTNRRPGG